MVKTSDRLPHAIFYGGIVLILLIFVGFIAWLNDQSYIYRLVPNLQTINCSDGPTNRSCSITYTLYNASNHTARTDLNGINGPGFAESNINDVDAILDDGTVVPVFAGSEIDFDSTIKAHETVQLTDSFTLPKGRRVNTIKILSISFEINR